MAVQERRAREREERHRLIVDTARELAEAEGWESVTTRKLADRIEYSQPVIYSHFKNMDALAGAVALGGFEELAVELGKARKAAGSAAEGLRALGQAYLDFAQRQPAMYDAMFVRRTDLTFASGETPPALRAGFEEFLQGVTPFATDGIDADTLAELYWSALHGLAALAQGNRLRPDLHQARLDLVVSLITG